MVRNLRPILCASAIFVSVLVNGLGSSAAAHDKKAEDAAKKDDPAAQIHGFHPIKKALAPLNKLESQGIELEQAIMKLSGPITELSGSMSSLDQTMTGVTDQLGRMKTKTLSTHEEVVGLRQDIAGMRKDIHDLKGPVTSLRKPIGGLSGPLGEIKQQLAIIVLAIFVGGLATALGIPLSCVIFWRYRMKLIPQMINEQPAETSEPPSAVAVDAKEKSETPVAP